MIKVKKCYGRKQPKEKSFITEFFDGGSKTPNKTAIDTCLPKLLQDQDKENVPACISRSPSLFQSFNNSEIKKLPIEQRNSKAKKIGPPKRIKVIQGNKNCRKKHKEVQHFSTKQCELLQPCWSEILEHEFVVQKLGNDDCPKAEEFWTKPSLKLGLRTSKTKTGLNENINEGNFESCSSKNKADESQCFPEFFIEDNSSEDIFLRPDSSRLIKKLNTHGRKNGNSGSKIQKHQRNTQHAMILTEYVNKNECISKKNKTYGHLNSPEFSIDSSGELFLSHITKRKLVEKTGKRNCITNLSKHHNLDSESANTKLGNNCSLSAQNSKKDIFSQIKYVSNGVQHAHNQIQNSNDLVTNFSTASNSPICRGDLANISEHFEDAASCMRSKTSDNEGKCNFIHREFNKSEDYHENLTKLKSNSNAANDNFKNLANAVDFLDDVIYSDAAEKRNGCKMKRAINFSPLSVEKNKFVTSTPVIENKSAANFSFNFLQTPLHMNNNSDEQFSSNLYLHNLYKTDLMSAYMRQSLQIKAHTISSPSSKFLIARNSHASSNPNKSYTVSQNKSLSGKEPDELTKAKILRLCNQESVASFSDIYNWNKLKVKKIGEGTYGEVFLVTKLKLSYVLKVIPVSQNSDDGFQDLQSVLSEIQISKCLSELRNNKINKTKNFTNIRRSLLVYGSYPSKLLDAWDDFKQAKSCYNNRPDIFEDNQVFAILELEFGGKDMSCFVLRNSLEAESILKQIAVSLAVAEEEYLFEHRDLHLGNILIQRVKRKNISYKLQGKDISFTSHGVHVTIIDFTLSCLYKDGYMYYYDLAEDVSLFEQSGDYQFDIYKAMRKHLENQWEECSLYSNVLWLKYLCKKLIEFKYSRPSSAAHFMGLKAVEAFSSQLLSCKSAFDTLTKCEITPIAFEKLAVYSDISKRSVLVSRNSTQKSKVSMGK